MQSAPAPATADHDGQRPAGGWRLYAYRIIFESDTLAGQRFDLALVALIVSSLAVVVLDSVASISARWGSWFDVLEWGFTLAFTAEYVLRLACVRHPARYAFSAFGLIDLLAILPTYLAFLLPGVEALIDVRVLRLLRIFRILKLGAYVREYGQLGQALVASRRKIAVFLSFVLLVVMVIATLMYVIEGPENGFTSIPVAMYWAITTITTVGFGDITPKSDLGRFLAAFMMLLGWGTLAVPTGIVSAEFVNQSQREAARRRHCGQCSHADHPPGARYCHACGAGLPPET